MAERKKKTEEVPVEAAEAAIEEAVVEDAEVIAAGREAGATIRVRRCGCAAANYNRHWKLPTAKEVYAD